MYSWLHVFLQVGLTAKACLVFEGIDTASCLGICYVVATFVIIAQLLLCFGSKGCVKALF